jgi:thiamine transporter
LTKQFLERIRIIGNGGAGISAERRHRLDSWNLIRVMPAKEIAVSERSLADEALRFRPGGPFSLNTSSLFDPKGVKENMEQQKVRILVEAALAAALALALSYLRLWHMPQGGSVSLENVPILIFALRWGLKAGLGAGAVAGLLQLILGGYVVHPLQALLDYPLAFGVLGLAALTPRPLWLGLTLGTFLRLVCHVLSGVVFFASYAPEGTNVWLYSTVYNGSYMLPNLGLSIILTYILWPRLKGR